MPPPAALGHRPRGAPRTPIPGRASSGLVRVRVLATDPVTGAGIADQLGRSAGVRVDHNHDDGPDVVVVAVDTVDAGAVDLVRTVRRTTSAGVVVIVARTDGDAFVDAVTAGAAVILRREEASLAQLESVILLAAAGEASLAPDLLGRLLHRLSGRPDEPPVGRAAAGLCLDERETLILRLLASGRTRAEIAAVVAYSRRTVSVVVSDLVRRHGLRNATHAVSLAINQGLI